ncbi:hypothetical protein F5897_001042 [Canibacter oris]|uniref:Uncharacterized protein n=1 Tax=Canibacter oris TaxID=1365628 RepID=A0A840DNW6_9MICO|nr:hypothetical protein [Canibacter oris]
MSCPSSIAIALMVPKVDPAKSSITNAQRLKTKATR